MLAPMLPNDEPILPTEKFHRYNILLCNICFPAEFPILRPTNKHHRMKPLHFDSSHDCTDGIPSLQWVGIAYSLQLRLQ